MRRLNTIILFLLVFFTHFSFAQIDNDNDNADADNQSTTSLLCQNNLRSAKTYYNHGNFDDVIEKIKSCIDNDRFSKEEDKLDATHLLANTYIASDLFDEAKVYVNKILDLSPDYRASNNDLVQFQIMVEDVKRIRAGAQVSSVSKFSESLYEAPATVILITEEQIKRRGYMDLVELLRDLPGFDISQTNGILYSHIYQRGYRMDNTNRMLLLVDGVEENDLWGNIAYLSRQYPLSNIKSVEIIYGPSSTIYGSNAFLGVVSINTKQPTELITGNNNIAVSAEAGYGEWKTQYADMTVATTFPKRELDLSATFRYFRSDEPNFEDEIWHDFEPIQLDDIFNKDNGYPTFENFYKFNLMLTDTDTDSSATTFFNTYKNHPNSLLFETYVDSNGYRTVLPSERGFNRALQLDNRAVTEQDYQDFTEIINIGAKIRFRNLLLGFQHWTKEEGLGVWFTDVQRGATDRWSPSSTFAYMRFDYTLSEKFYYSSFIRYKLHGYKPGRNYLTTLTGYRNGGLKLENLMSDDRSYYKRTYLDTRSNQLRAENRIYYKPNPYQLIMVGMENRFSAIQDNYATISLADSIASTKDTTYNALIDDDTYKHYFSNEVGLYMQATYEVGRWWKKLKDLELVMGYRWDYKANYNQPIDAENSIRGVAVYHPKNYIVKLFYTRAFKYPTNFDIYSTVSGTRDLAGGTGLNAETVINRELSIRRFLDNNKTSSVQILGYSSVYNNAIESVATPYNGGSTTQFQNAGTRRIQGLEATIDYNFTWREQHHFYVYGNYTYLEPLETTNDTTITLASGNTIYGIEDEFAESKYYWSEPGGFVIADMARHKFNIGLNYSYKNFNANLRMNYLGKRITGENIPRPLDATGEIEDRDATTVRYNPFDDGIEDDGRETFSPATIFHAAFTYRVSSTGLSFQLVANNIFNEKYYQPGIRTAEMTNFSGRLPQNPRAFHLKVRYNFSYNTAKQQIDELIE